jgi:hypothetical protein
MLLIPVLSYGWPNEPDEYSQRESTCIGAQDKKCLAELKRECESMGGKWHGEIVGRGRQWGCERPTRDKGKRCTDSSQCEGMCLAEPAPTASQLPSLTKCQCASTTLFPKGRAVLVCTKNGIQAIHAD